MMADKHSNGASRIANVFDLSDCGSRCTSSTGYSSSGSSNECVAFEFKPSRSECWHYLGSMDCNLKTGSDICHYQKTSACRLFIISSL